MNEPRLLMAGKRGLIMGVANDRSIAWGIAKARARRRAPSSRSPIRARRSRSACGRWPQRSAPTSLLPCDVTDAASLDAAFATLQKDWGRLDFVVHAIAFSDKDELKGKYVDTPRDNFLRTLDISCYSFTDVCRARDAR